jgi:hypothetical protein
MGTGTAYIAGNISPDTFTPGTGTVVFNGTTTLSAAYTFHNMTVAASSSLSTGGKSVTINGTFQNIGTLNRKGGDYVSKTDATQGTVTYAGTAGTIQTYSGDDYYDLTLNGASFTMPASMTVKRNLTITGSAGLSAGSYTLSLGNFENSGLHLRHGNGGPHRFGRRHDDFRNDHLLQFDEHRFGKTITLGATQTIATGGSFSISGSSSSTIGLSGGGLTLNGTATAVAYYATINNSTVSASSDAYYSTLNGTTTNWNALGTSYTWTGEEARRTGRTPTTGPPAPDIQVIPPLWKIR